MAGGTHAWQALRLGIWGSLLVLSFLISTSGDLVPSPLGHFSREPRNEGRSPRSKEATEVSRGHPVKGV